MRALCLTLPLKSDGATTTLNMIDMRTDRPRYTFDVSHGLGVDEKPSRLRSGYVFRAESKRRRVYLANQS
jgi:hypothetical protein